MKFVGKIDVEIMIEVVDIVATFFPAASQFLPIKL